MVGYRVGTDHHMTLEGHICCWLETPQKHFARLTYFPDSRPTDTGWHTFLSDELDRYWNLNKNADVPLSSAYPALNADYIEWLISDNTGCLNADHHVVGSGFRGEHHVYPD